MTYRPVRFDDYEKMRALWDRSPGVGLSSADEPEPIRRYLEHNPGLSLLAVDGERVVGTILAGHDGRRGYLHHLAVDESYRRAGIGRELVRLALDALAAEGIAKCHLFMFRKNRLGARFWRALSWVRRNDIVVYSRDLA